MKEISVGLFSFTDQLPCFAFKLFFCSGYGGFSDHLQGSSISFLASQIIMPTPKGGHQNRQRGLVCERSSSFPRKSSTKMAPEKLRRLKTEPDLSGCSGVALGQSFSPERKLKLTKMLINVTIQGSSGPVHVVIPVESTVSDLITASLKQYKKEGRRPILSTMDPSRFDLHYSQFCLESLQKEDKLVGLDSRNFFLCRKRFPVDYQPGQTATSCSEATTIEIKIAWPEWLNFSDILM